MKKGTFVEFDKKAYQEYLELQKLVEKGTPSKKKPTYAQLLSSLNIALKNIKLNYKHGDLIPRKYISKETIKKYGTDRLFRVELVGYWRLLYTIRGDEVKIIAIILEFMDHDQYNKVFGYKQR